jgi:hypothetical protein
MDLVTGVSVSGGALLNRPWPRATCRHVFPRWQKGYQLPCSAPQDTRALRHAFRVKWRRNSCATSSQAGIAGTLPSALSPTEDTVSRHGWAPHLPQAGEADGTDERCSRTHPCHILRLLSCCCSSLEKGGPADGSPPANIWDSCRSRPGIIGLPSTSASDAGGLFLMYSRVSLCICYPSTAVAARPAQVDGREHILLSVGRFKECLVVLCIIGGATFFFD